VYSIQQPSNHPTMPLTRLIRNGKETAESKQGPSSTLRAEKNNGGYALPPVGSPVRVAEV